MTRLHGFGVTLNSQCHCRHPNLGPVCTEFVLEYRAKICANRPCADFLSSSFCNQHIHCTGSTFSSLCSNTCSAFQLYVAVNNKRNAASVMTFDFNLQSDRALFRRLGQPRLLAIADTVLSLGYTSFKTKIRCNTTVSTKLLKAHAGYKSVRLQFLYTVKIMLCFSAYALLAGSDLSEIFVTLYFPATAGVITCGGRQAGRV